MSREEKPCIPLKIIKVLSDYTQTLISSTEASALNKNFLDDLMTVFADNLGHIPKYEVKQIVGLQTITLY